jgi:hypothetical protein
MFEPAVITLESGCNTIALNDAEQYRVEYFQKDRYVVYISEDLVLNFLHDESSKAYVCILTDEILEALSCAETNKTCIHVNHITVRRMKLHFQS